MMNVLVVGGSGRVGTQILPFLKSQFKLRVFDLVAPADDEVEYVSGDVTDPAAITAAAGGMDAMIYMVMPQMEKCRDVVLSYDLNVKGLHIALDAACNAGIRRIVHASTGSVHAPQKNYFFPTEEMPLGTGSVYGWTKSLGERICQWFCKYENMTIGALRLFQPMSHDDWLDAPSHHKWGEHYGYVSLAPSDTASAFSAGLTRDVTCGFHPVFIAGDHEGKHVNLSRAQDLLDWRPLQHRPTDPT